jgi:hydroxymethylpyrimidine pyrophosphatase-like HAD family hydrolase
MTMNYLDKVRRNLNAQERISFDYDGTLSTPQGQALAKRFISKGYNVFIVTARSQRLSRVVLEVADKLGIPHNRVKFTGSNSAKVDYIVNSNIRRHYDNNADVVKELKDKGIEATLVNYE